MGVVGISLTDTAGDFLSYTVDVTSLTLTKADGTVVQALSQRARVDFARLVDLTEFVTAVTISVRQLRQRDAEPRLHQRRYSGR